MRNLLFVVILFFIIPLTGYGQYGSDFGVSLGGSSYLGEFGGGEGEGRGFIADMDISSTRPNFNVFYRKKVSPKFSLKGALSYISLSGDDSKSKNPPRRARNLNFKNNLIELLATAEWYLYRSNDVARTGRYGVDFNLYVFTGVGAFYSNPKGQIDSTGQWVSLRNLKSEGVSYSPINIAIPLGIGFYYTFDRRYRIGMEAGFRGTLTDYIDDISSTYANDYDGITNKTTPELLEEINEEFDSRLTPENFDAGSPRGGEGYDSYLMISASFSFVIPDRSFYGKRRRRPTNKHRRRMSKFKF